RADQASGPGARAERTSVDGENRRTVRIPTPDGEEVLVDPRSHREDVVERLLERGVSVETLSHLLPEWAPLIERVGIRVAPAGVVAAAGAGATERPPADR